MKAGLLLLTPAKRKILNNLKFDSYCSFGASEVHGIGVIAIRDILENVNPFIVANKNLFHDIIPLSEKEVSALPKEVAARIRDLFIKCGGIYPVHLSGLNGIGVPFYMNHSFEPNVVLDYDFGIVGPARVAQLTMYCPFKTLRDIKKGEELCWDYTTCKEADDIEKQFKFLKKPGVLGKLWKKFTK